MVKEKPTSSRTYDEDGFKRRAACLCFRDETLQEVLLITSSRAPDGWVVPGGCIEPMEEPEVAAEREVFEEAGVSGTVRRNLGTVENTEKRHRTWLYVLVVTQLASDWEDKKLFGRKREWFHIDEAKVKLKAHKPIQCSYLDLLKTETIPNGKT